MVGRPAELFYRREIIPTGTVALHVDDFTRKPLVNHVSFDVKHGEIFGIGGMVGSGRTELVNLLFGVDKRESGSLLLNGKKISARSPKEAIQRGLCLITEDRKESGLLLARPVKENISIVMNEQKGGLISLEEEVGKVHKMVERLKIHLSSIDQDAESLSGGNQQKSVLGRWLLNDADVYLFDEPTKGVDIGAKEEIYRIMTDLARQGKAIIMISSDMPELISMSDRIGIMRNGEMVAILSSDEATEERLVKEYLGFNTN
jgi:ribose transport system ATP-binding protein